MYLLKSITCSNFNYNNKNSNSNHSLNNSNLGNKENLKVNSSRGCWSYSRNNINISKKKINSNKMLWLCQGNKIRGCRM